MSVIESPTSWMHLDEPVTSLEFGSPRGKRIHFSVVTSDSTTTDEPGSKAGGSRVARRPKPELGVAPAWWPIAHSEEVAQHPKAFRLGIRDLAVYRDLEGTVRAVDDSCPHRRLPLSMGRITEDGYLQCAYHGWCFDGANGRCTAIPNLSEDEKVPGSIRVAAFTTAENVADVLGFGLRTKLLARAVGPPTGEEPDDGTTMFDALVVDGLVLVWSGEEDPEPGSRPEPHPVSGEVAFSGTVEIRAPHDRVAEALLYNPGVALGLGGLVGAGDELSSPEVKVRGGAISVRRDRIALATPRIATFESVVRRVVTSTTTMVATTGLARVEVDADGRHPAARIVVALTPLGPYRTVVRWRGEVDGGRAQTKLIRAMGTGRRLAGRAADRAEEIADRVPSIVDDGIEAFRELRSTPNEQPTDGGPP